MKYSVKTKNKVLEIISEEIAEINSMKPEEDETDVTFNIKKQHWLAECRAIKKRIDEDIN